MRIFNKFSILVLSAMIVLSGINVYAAPEDVWYSDVMETANKMGIINADEQPEETISNADFVRLAVNFIEDKNDVVLYMEYARQQGYVLITEMTDETKPVTRQSVAKVISRMLNLPDVDIDMTNVADWDTTCPKCKEDIGKCYAYGIMSGYEDNTFRGRYPATKAEVIATMLNAKAYLNIAEEK